jgi:hypothetical protein
MSLEFVSWLILAGAYLWGGGEITVRLSRRAQK